MKKLLRITFLASILWNALILAVTPLVLKGYALSAEAARLVVELVLLHNLFNALFVSAGPAPSQTGCGRQGM